MTNGECGRADFSTYCSFGSQHSTSCSPHWPASPLIQEINWTRMLCGKLIHPDVHFWSFPAGDVVWPAGQNMLPSGAGGTDVSLFSTGQFSGGLYEFIRGQKGTNNDKVCPWNVGDLLEVQNYNSMVWRAEGLGLGLGCTPHRQFLACSRMLGKQWVRGTEQKIHLN